MSEYQYYEFQAIDRPLTKAEQAELRALSTRASISATRFHNEYHWGDFKGDPLALMHRYFDIHVYEANWGTRQLMLRLPRPLLDLDAARPFCATDWLELHAQGDHIVVEFRAEDEEGRDWEQDSEEWLPSLLALRAELMEGDLRPLYVAWLASAGAGLLDDDDEATEPPLPAGLATPTAAQQALARFLRVGDDLLAVAAERSAPLRARRAAPGDLARWLATLPAADKDAALARVVEGQGPRVRAELLRRFDQDQRGGQPTAAESAPRRGVAALLLATEERIEARRREEARRAAEAEARRARAAAAARVAYLNDLATRQEAAWRQVDALAEVKRGKEYDQAAQLLIDLRDLSVRDGTTDAFRERVRAVRLRHGRKPAFIERLDRAALPR